ncbi:MAG: hypothetical protein R3A13_02420 [Bdellovibrionota bacterium]
MATLAQPNPEPTPSCTSWEEWEPQIPAEMIRRANLLYANDSQQLFTLSMFWPNITAADKRSTPGTELGKHDLKEGMIVQYIGAIGYSNVPSKNGHTINTLEVLELVEHRRLYCS